MRSFVGLSVITHLAMIERILEHLDKSGLGQRLSLVPPQSLCRHDIKQPGSRIVSGGE